MRLLPISTVLLLLGTAATHGQTTRPTTRPAASGPTAEELADKLLARPTPPGKPVPAASTEAPVLDLTSGPGAVAPNAPAVPVIREGTHLINVTGRLSHANEGQQAIFTFDVDGKTMLNPPMFIVPNLKLASMESAVSSTSNDVHFRVSGTVTEYKNRNYILLDKAVVVSDLEQKM